MNALLHIDSIHVHYGAIHALKGVSMSVDPGRLVALIGANGAGKSTLLRAVAGLNRITEGSILWQGSPIANRPPHQISRTGIALVPEGRRVFANLTVKENLFMGGYRRHDKEEMERDMDGVMKTFQRLRERFHQKAGTLSGGEQQMLALGRALMARPTLLMLDEPSLGLAPIMVDEVYRVIADVHDAGKTVLLIEQNAMAALDVADYGYVMETGLVTLEGPGKTLQDDPAVRRKYLGVDIEG